MSTPPSENSASARPANVLGLDYAEGARALGTPATPGDAGIIDIHTHISGTRAAEIYGKVCGAFGVTQTYSMTRLPWVEQTREVLGDSIRFIAFPSFDKDEPMRGHGETYLRAIETFASRHGSRMLKLWNAPRIRDFVEPEEWDDVATLDAPWRARACELGEALGMMFMVHVADPDTWFSTAYADASRYGTKREQYIGLERMLDRFAGPWIAAHMGGWPEDLAFLSTMLDTHRNLYLDTSATKWVARELSKHPRDEVVEFFTRYEGRLLFGSDIVVTDEHLAEQESTEHPMAGLASSEGSAWELYASRYFVLRTMFESGYDGPSPIADPDLMKVDPEHHDGLSSPRLRGLSLEREVLESLYRTAAEDLVGRWWRDHGGW